MLLDDSIDVDGLPTTGGSIALQNSTPKDDSTIVAKLKAAGAIILGKTNVSELNGLFDANMPEGYSSLGGQVLLPSDTDKTPAGSSGGSAAATASGLAALTVGMETSTDTAQLIAPGRRRRRRRPQADGRARQPRRRPAGRQVAGLARPDRADGLDVAARAAGDRRRRSAGSGHRGRAGAANYLAGLVPTALSGKQVAVINSTTAPYPTVVTALQALGRHDDRRHASARRARTRRASSRASSSAT